MPDKPTSVLHDRLVRLATAVRHADAMVADAEPEGVHDLRVALRRTRSLLRSFRPQVRDDCRRDAEAWVEEARWAGGELGQVRDAEVVHDRLAALLEQQPPELLLGAVARRISDRARVEDRAGRERIAALRDEERYQHLLTDLDRLLAEDPFADDVTESDLRDRLRKDWRRLRRRARAADEAAADPGESAEAALHGTRKAAKRARYAAEAVAPLLGGKASKMADVAEQVQDSLGTHRDTLLTREVLRLLGVQAHLDGDNGFTFGRLHGIEEGHGDAALDAYRAVRPKLDRKKHRRWMRP